jgi:hypothetical protein
VFGILRERNPDLTGERRRTVLKPPQVSSSSSRSSSSLTSRLSAQGAVCNQCSACYCHAQLRQCIRSWLDCWCGSGDFQESTEQLVVLTGGASAGATLRVCMLCVLQVAREGTKKTVFTNFMDLCKVCGLLQKEHAAAAEEHAAAAEPAADGGSGKYVCSGSSTACSCVQAPVLSSPLTARLCQTQPPLSRCCASGHEPQQRARERVPLG